MVSSRSQPPASWLPAAQPHRCSRLSSPCRKCTSRPRAPASVSQLVPLLPTRLVPLPPLPLPLPLVLLVPLAPSRCPPPRRPQPLRQPSMVPQSRPRTAESCCPWCSQPLVSWSTHKRVHLHHDDDDGEWSREKEKDVYIFMSFLNQSAFCPFPSALLWLVGRVGALINNRSWVRGRVFAWRLA